MNTLLQLADVDTYIAACVRIAAVGVIVVTIELLRDRETWSDSGLMSWPISRLDYRWSAHGALAAPLNAVLAYPRVSVLFCARLAVSAVMVVAPSSLILSPALAIPAAMLSLVLPLRSRLGLNGADQVDLLVFGGLALVSLVPHHEVKVVFLLFLTAQCVLAYSVAGIAKAISPGWRDGRYLVQILCIRTYCSAGTGDFAQSHRGLVRLIAWGVIGWECLFVLALLLPPPVAVLFLLAGVVFHIGTALVMGLNDFLWAFSAAYPAVFFCVLARGW